MSVISTIDCTLRDGGYLNNWEFDDDFRLLLLKALTAANTDIIECGFINNKSGNDEHGTHFKSIEKINSILKENALNNSHSRFSVMMKLDEYEPENMPRCEKAENCVSIIRVMVYKNEIRQSIDILKKISEKGYEVHIQPTIISHYSDEEIVNMINTFNQINYGSISIVDTFGALNESDIRRIAMLFDKYANKDACLSLHCHNNLSRAYKNAEAFTTSVNVNRDVFVDSTVNGIGRGAGNLSTEILLTWLKTERKANYSVLPIKEFSAATMKKFKPNIKECDYYAYTITAKKNMHPNYATWLIINNYNRNHICRILELITPDKYESFDFEYIKSLCEIFMLKV